MSATRRPAGDRCRIGPAPPRGGASRFVHLPSGDRVPLHVEPSVSDITRSIEQGIAGIDRELSRLTDARASLERALVELGTAGGPDPPPEPAPATQRARPRRGRTHASSRKRAPRGHNRQLIVEFLKSNGPTAASQIAKQTGVNRAVVYSNLTAMVESGEVSQDASSDTKALFAVGD